MEAEQLNPDSLHLDICAFQFDMAAELALTIRKTTTERDVEENNEIEKGNEQNKDNYEYDNNEENMQTLSIYNEVKAYLWVHNVNIEDIMEGCTKFVTAIVLKQLLKEKMGTTTTWTSR
eukprot:6457471-Amphidinium_carterae.1